MVFKLSQEKSPEKKTTKQTVNSETEKFLNMAPNETMNRRDNTINIKDNIMLCILFD